MILGWQTEALEPVHQVVGEEQKVEVRLVGRKLPGGNLGQRIVGP